MWSDVGGRLQHLANRAVRAGTRHPVCLCCLAGFLAGTALDLDHVPAVLFGIRTGFVPFALVPQIGEGRNLHGLALVVGGLGGACAGGHLVFLVLSESLPEIRHNLISSARRLESKALQIKAQVFYRNLSRVPIAMKSETN
jgi:hypothetical protein